MNSENISIDPLNMRFLKALPLLLVAFLDSAAGVKVLLTNDDGWAVAQVRAEYDALKAAGHNVRFAYLPSSSHAKQTSRWSCLPLQTTDQAAVHQAKRPRWSQVAANSRRAQGTHLPSVSTLLIVCFLLALCH